jgi:hypothetical protein
MFIESFLAKSIYGKLIDSEKESFESGENNGFSFIGFLGMILWVIMVIAYLIVVIRAVIVAYNCQGIVQALLALFMYPVYLVWNFTTLVQKGLCTK